MQVYSVNSLQLGTEPRLAVIKIVIGQQEQVPALKTQHNFIHFNNLERSRMPFLSVNLPILAVAKLLSQIVSLILSTNAFC